MQDEEVTYSAQRSHKDIVASEERNERLRSGDKLPRYEGHTQDCTDDLPSPNCEIARKEAGHIGAEGNGVCA